MNHLLDTCAVAEFTKPQPDAGLLEWLRATPESNLHLSAVTLGEIQRGIGRLAVSARRQASVAGRSRAAQAGHTPPVLDALIAATASTHRMLLVTRTEADFAAGPESASRSSGAQRTHTLM